MSYRPEELLVTAIAGLLDGTSHVAVGANSPIPAAAALLARERSGGGVRVSLLGSRQHSFFTDGARELFDCAAQGRIDAFFLGGAQIDGAANINLVGIGDYPQSAVRLAGSFGSAYLYFLVPRVILFQPEHTRRTLVSQVDFISAPGVSPPGVYRPGGPVALVTGRCVFSFDRSAGRFRLETGASRGERRSDPRAHGIRVRRACAGAGDTRARRRDAGVAARRGRPRARQCVSRVRRAGARARGLSLDQAQPARVSVTSLHHW